MTLSIGSTRELARWLGGALLVAPGLAQSAPDYSPRSFQHGGDTLTIRWDSWGVPEVDSTGRAGALFGWGYVQALDRFFQMEMARREMQGRQAELLGADPIGSGKSPSDSDRDVLLLRIPHFLQLAHDRLAQDHPQHHSQLLAFSAGVNRYLEEKLGPQASWTTSPTFGADLETVHPLFADFPLTGARLRPWTPLDCLAALDHVSNPRDPNVMEAAILGYSYRYLTYPAPDNQVYAEYYRGSHSGPPLTHEQALLELLGPAVFDEEAVAVKRLDVPPNRLREIFAYARRHGWHLDRAHSFGDHGPPGSAAPSFSHGIALGGARVEANAGRAVVLAMPQLEVTKMLFEASVRAAGDFSSRGISFPGCPGHLVGFNDTLAWGVTSAGSTPFLTYELRMGRDELGNFDADSYVLDGRKLPVTSTPDSYFVRAAPGQLAWTRVDVIVRWAPDLHLPPSHPEQTVSEGLPIVTERMSATLSGGGLVRPLEGFQYALFHPRWFDNRSSTARVYLDMLASGDVFELDAALQAYANPAVTLYAGDANGDVAFWYLRELPLHSAHPDRSPLGVHGLNTARRSKHLVQDVIPIRLLPHVVNPLHRLESAQRSPMENIVVCGNSGVVGSWYPLPIYGGHGDSLRSLRLWQLVRAYHSAGQSPGSPDDRFAPEQVLGFQYDDVDPYAHTTARAALHQVTTQGEVFGQDARNMLSVLATGSWLTDGGHAHSVQPEMGGVSLMGASLRTEPEVVALSRVYGQAQAGRSRLVRDIERLFSSGSPGDIFDVLADGDLDVRDALHALHERALGNGYSLAVYGTPSGSSTMTHEPLGPPAQWRPAYHARPFNVKIGGRNTTGARFRVGYHADLLGYGSLDPDHDIDSAKLANPRFGVGNMTSSFYTQWTHFGWLDDADDHAQATFGPGNSLHPASPFFHSVDWERDNLLFDLEDTITNDPRRYVRDAPLP